MNHDPKLIHQISWFRFLLQLHQKAVEIPPPLIKNFEFMLRLDKIPILISYFKIQNS